MSNKGRYMGYSLIYCLGYQIKVKSAGHVAHSEALVGKT